MRKNCVSINLKKDKIIIKLNEDTKQEELVECLKKKLPELKKLYKDEKTPINVAGKVLKNKEIEEIDNYYSIRLSGNTKNYKGKNRCRN